MRVRPDGSGTVTVTADLDAEAAAQLGDPANLALGDLTAAGWELDGPTGRRGGLRIVAVRRFASAEQLPAVLEEVGGPDGVFRDTSLVIEDGFAATTSTFRTKLHLSGDPAQLSDEQLTALLGGLPLGRTSEELAAIGADRADAATLTVRVSLPGGVDDTDGALRAGTATWSAPITGGTATDEVLHAASTQRRTTTLVLVGAGVVLVLAALVWAVVPMLTGRARGSSPSEL